MRTLLALFVALIALPATVSAQTVPVVIPVQGILTDAQDQPVQGNVAMTFTIYDSADGALFTETIPVDVENGFYSINLGTSQALSAADFQTGAAVQLGIKVGNGTEMTPRLEFGSVPYALASDFAVEAVHAQNADSALTAEAVSDGTITTAKLVDGAVTLDKLADKTQVYRVTTGFCEQEPGTLMTKSTCAALQYDMSSCNIICQSGQKVVRNCTGACTCQFSLVCLPGNPCPPARGPACANTPAGYLVNP